MFNTEESINHLQRLRQKVILMKDGKSEEGITPLKIKDKGEEKILTEKKKQKEMNA